MPHSPLTDILHGYMWTPGVGVTGLVPRQLYANQPSGMSANGEVFVGMGYLEYARGSGNEFFSSRGFLYKKTADGWNEYTIENQWGSETSLTNTSSDGRAAIGAQLVGENIESFVLQIRQGTTAEIEEKGGIVASGRVLDIAKLPGSIGSSANAISGYVDLEKFLEDFRKLKHKRGF